MTIPSLHRVTHSPVPASAGIPALSLAVLLLFGANPSVAAGTTTATASSTLQSAAEGLQADYRQRQWHRLAGTSDRDSLIAAVLIGLPTESESEPMPGQAELEQRLAGIAGQDPLALFVLASACQSTAPPCSHREYYEALVRIAPENAVHWLLLPNGGAPNAAQLHRAGLAAGADSHTRELLGIARAALGDLPVEIAPPGVDSRELARLLRRNTIAALPLPTFGTAVVMCKAAIEPMRSDCIGLGRKLIVDRSGSILPMMIGSAIVRRLLKGTPEDAVAIELRRDYVWLSEHQQSGDARSEEQLQNEMIEFGEWEAWQRQAERLGVSRAPPPGWLPADPQLLLLQEDRVAMTPKP